MSKETGDFKRPRQDKGAAMSLADELWEKYLTIIMGGVGPIRKDAFIAALKEYGEAVRKRDAELCREVETERMPASTPGFYVTNSGAGCAAAIEREPLP